VEEHPAYRTYWQRKEMLRRSFPTFPVRRWWESDGLCEIEQVYFEAARNARSLLDVGAGDLRIQKKFRSAGFRGEYHTQDVGGENRYTYRDLNEVKGRYEAILCLDVLEHLPLVQGLTLVDTMVRLLEPGGTLVIQTPNAAYLPDPRSWDMTHVHVYNLPDLYAYLICEKLEVTGYRVELVGFQEGVVRKLKRAAASYLKQKLLGCDFANNIAVVARRLR
jgi:hypothetical protein